MKSRKIPYRKIPIPDSIWRRTRVHAIEEGTHATEIVRRALRLYLDSLAPPGAKPPET